MRKFYENEEQEIDNLLNKVGEKNMEINEKYDVYGKNIKDRESGVPIRYGVIAKKKTVNIRDETGKTWYNMPKPTEIYFSTEEEKQFIIQKLQKFKF